MVSFAQLLLVTKGERGVCMSNYKACKLEKVAILSLISGVLLEFDQQIDSGESILNLTILLFKQIDPP